MPSSSQHRRRQPPRCLSHPFQASQKCRKTEENQRISNVIHSGAKIDQKCSQYRFRSSQVESKMAILQIFWPILKVSWPILVTTCRQLCPSFANLRPNFASICNHMPPYVRSAPRAPNILLALNLPRFSIPRELHCCRFLGPSEYRFTALRNQSFKSGF